MPVARQLNIPRNVQSPYIFAAGGHCHQDILEKHQWGILEKHQWGYYDARHQEKRENLKIADDLVSDPDLAAYPMPFSLRTHFGRDAKSGSRLSGR